MHVEFHVKCIQTNFGGRALSSFTDFAPFHLWPNFVLYVFSFYFSYDIIWYRYMYKTSA